LKPEIPADPVRRAISREELANLPVRRYEGEVRLVATPADVQEAAADMLAESVVGFDTETRPSFLKGEYHLPCLVQVATASRVYLFPLRARHAFEDIAALLCARHIAKAGVALAYDLRELKHVFAFRQEGVVDLGAVARRCGVRQTGVRNLAAMFLGYRVPKGASTTNWARPRLSAAQVAYAATDAWVCRQLYLCFQRLGLLPESH
jgi:ribonuclease D